jgi:RimJ/RimL family protein N-acetyltransferase
MKTRKTYPTLETQRTLLKVPTFEISDELQILANDRDVAKNLSQLPYPYSIENAKAFIKKSNELFYEDDGEQIFAIFLKGSNKLMGMCELDISTEHNHATLGYWLGKEFWGNGYATEVAKRLVSYGFEELNLYRITCQHFHTNQASGHVMIKAGFIHEGTRRGHFKKDGEYLDILDYGILKEELVS